MFFENGLIILQAFRATTSHFNIKTPVDILIFNFMGIFILSVKLVVVDQLHTVGVSVRKTEDDPPVGSDCD